MNRPFELVCDVGALLAEGPISDAEHHLLRFTDIQSCNLHAWNPKTGTLETENMAEEVGCFVLTKAGDVVAAMRTGVFDLKTRKWLTMNPENTDISRFNDSTTDQLGRFLMGTVDPSKQSGAALYRFDSRGPVQLVDGLQTSNGLALSPDGRTLYHSDTPRFVVYAYDYDIDHGTVANQRKFVRLEPTDTDKGRPDGAAIDVDGCYWTALYQGARVHRYSPNGKLLSVHPVPAKSPTMPCFGGPI